MPGSHLAVRAARRPRVPGKPASRAPRSASGPAAEPGAGQAFGDFFRCEPEVAAFDATPGLSTEDGYFTVGGAVCYGSCAGSTPSHAYERGLPDVSEAMHRTRGRLSVPFDFSAVVANLQYERYRQPRPSLAGALAGSRAAQELYYRVRPFLGVPVRKHVQRLRLAGWRRIAFPEWPVDLSVDTLMRSAMTAILQDVPGGRVPFIWFWPEGRDACVMMTHDIEGPAGAAFTPALMDLDESYGMTSAFQIVPEHWAASTALLKRLRARGFEINIHDFNHDGTLFRDSRRFLERVREINKLAADFHVQGFRSGAMYREQSWYGAFQLSYDMSVPNVAHLEPQRGGCCSILPYFVGDVLELPLTTVQDYSLFHVLGDYSTTLWEQQIAVLLSRHGLISFIAHPDYLREERARQVYVRLLEHLSALRRARDLWFALPGDVNRWWRSRSLMRLVRRGRTWTVEGPDSERARVAYAVLRDGRLVYEVQNSSTAGSARPEGAR